VALRAGLAAGVDLVHIAPSAKNGGVLADESRLATFAMLEAAVGVRARLSDHLELLASAAVEVELVDTRYVVQSVGGLAVVEDPWAIRPWLLLGIGFF
jgi:hypothetical protein